MCAFIKRWFSSYWVSDIDRAKIDKLGSSGGVILSISATNKFLHMRLTSGRMRATDAFDAISEVDVIVICVPTPLTAKREPDLGPVLNTGAALVPHIRSGQP